MPPAKKHIPSTKTGVWSINFKDGRQEYIRRLLKIDPTTESNCQSRVAREIRKHTGGLDDREFAFCEGDNLECKPQHLAVKVC